MSKEAKRLKNQREYINEVKKSLGKSQDLNNWVKNQSQEFQDYLKSPSSLGELMQEVEKWSEKYEFSFQFWGKGNNTFYIYKDGIDMLNIGGFYDSREAIENALMWVYKTNRVRIDLRPSLKYF
jgi:hypothetical protein